MNDEALRRNPTHLFQWRLYRRFNPQSLWEYGAHIWPEPPDVRCRGLGPPELPRRQRLTWLQFSLVPQNEARYQCDKALSVKNWSQRLQDTPQERSDTLQMNSVRTWSCQLRYDQRKPPSVTASSPDLFRFAEARCSSHGCSRHPQQRMLPAESPTDCRTVHPYTATVLTAREASSPRGRRCPVLETDDQVILLLAEWAENATIQIGSSGIPCTAKRRVYTWCLMQL